MECDGLARLFCNKFEGRTIQWKSLYVFPVMLMGKDVFSLVNT